MMLPGFRLSLGSPKPPPPGTPPPVSVEHEADTLMDVGDSLDMSYHTDTFNYMAPPSPASPFSLAQSCTQPHSTPGLGLGAALGVQVDDKLQEHDSPILAEWLKKKAVEADKKANDSQAQHQRMLEQANKEKQEFYARRTARISKAKAENREKEKAYVASLNNLKNAANDWEAVIALTELEKHTSSKPESSKKLVVDLSKPGTSSRRVEPKGSPLASTSADIKGKSTKPGGETDLSRMRQVLLKLKRNPPKEAKGAI